MTLTFLTLLLLGKLKGFFCKNFFGICVAIMMVIIAVGSIAVAISQDPEPYPTRIRIALLIFPILQVPIAALRFTWCRDIGNGFPLTETVSQFPAVYIAYGAGVWLEALLFA